MAVKKNKKKYKSKNNKKKYNKNITNKRIKKEEIVVDKEINNKLDDLLGDITTDLDNVVVEDNKNNNYRGIFLFGIIIFILGLIVIFSPRIKLSGELDMVISYKDSYVEPGYIANIYNRDISSDIEIDSDLIEGVIGEYQIVYYVDKLGIRFKKTRNVKVVDDDSPKIEVYSDAIHICPYEEIPNFDYRAIDEYEGDITSRVEKIVLDDEVLLRVKDSSLNEEELSIKIDRVDSVSPVINLKGDTIMYISYGSKYNEPGYSVSDNCSDNLDDKVVVSGNVGTDVGTYILTYEVNDESGNRGSATRKVVVGNKIRDDGIINNGTIYLTFDDGPNEGTTNKILDILKDEVIEATFFVTGNGSDSLIKRIYDEGHTIGLHTYSHDYSYIYSSIDNYFSDLNKISDRVKRITGYDSKIIRFPGGSSNTISKNYKIGIMTELSYLVLNEGYHYFDWNVDAMDASTAKSSGDVYYNVTSNLSMNRANVVLMHDTKSITVGALRDIIRYGKENGYSFKKIDMNTKMVKHGISN